MSTLEALPGRSRKSADQRASDLIERADQMVNRTRSADISLQELADELSISRALVYAYFPDRFRLIDAVLARHVALLEEAGLSIAATSGPLEQRAQACARIILRHSVNHGATIELVMRDRDVVRHLDGTALRQLRRWLSAVGKRAAGELRMRRGEAMAFVELLSVIPLQAARRIVADGIQQDIAEDVCARLIRSSIGAQVPYGSG